MYDEPDLCFWSEESGAFLDRQHARYLEAESNKAMQSKHPLYDAWIHMKNRVENPKDKAYNRYGGRGIKITPRWKSFWTFVVDMGDRPSPRHTLERRDNSGDYTKENCYWATYTEQNFNRRIFKNNSSGITGVSRLKNKWRVTFGKTCLYYGEDFFEACCVRKTAELKRTV